MRKLSLVVIVNIIFGISLYADNCETWTWKEVPIKMKTCVYTNGGSGYIDISNTSNKDVKICWILTYYDGKQRKGCKLRFRANKSAKSSEYHLSKSKLKNVRITKFKYLD